MTQMESFMLASLFGIIAGGVVAMWLSFICLGIKTLMDRHRKRKKEKMDNTHKED